MTPLFLILIAVIILTCVWLNSVSSRIGIPTLLAFILLGVVFGNVGAIPIRLDNPTFAQQTCTVALIFIMFYGGFGTRWDAVKPVVWEAGLLASVGVSGVDGSVLSFCPSLGLGAGPAARGRPQFYGCRIGVLHPPFQTVGPAEQYGSDAGGGKRK